MATITSIVSLNQLVEWFESFADRHYFLKDFGFGEPYDINYKTNGVPLYVVNIR